MRIYLNKIEKEVKSLTRQYSYIFAIWEINITDWNMGKEEKYIETKVIFKDAF